MEEYTLICEDSIDGILSAVYDAYSFKKERGIPDHNQIHIATEEPAISSFFMQYEHIEMDREKSNRVIRTIIREFGDETYYHLCLAMASTDEKKADAVYHTIVIGLAEHDRNVLERLHTDCVHNVFQAGRKAGNEAHYYTEFLRFAELENGLLYAKIGASCNILPFIVPHFADRLPSENFIIYDEKHQLFALHPKRSQWYLASSQEFDEEQLVYSDEEKKYAELFCHFVDKIAIKERYNPKCQMNHLPLHYRPYMVEFADSQKTKSR